MDDWIECDECGGFGKCEYTVGQADPMSWRGGELIGVVMDCQKCDGLGLIEKEEDEEELEITFTPDW